MGEILGSGRTLLDELRFGIYIVQSPWNFCCLSCSKEMKLLPVFAALVLASCATYSDPLKIDYSKYDEVLVTLYNDDGSVFQSKRYPGNQVQVDALYSKIILNGDTFTGSFMVTSNPR